MKHIATVLLSISQALVLGALVLLPIFFLPLQWTTIPHAKMSLFAALVVLACLFWIIGRVASGRLVVSRSYIILAALLLPVAYVVSALFSGAGASSFIGVGVERDTVVAVILWATGLFAAAVVLNTRRSIIHAYKLLLLGIGLAGVFHLIARIFGEGVVSLGGLLQLPPASIMGSWHDLAIALGLGALLAAGLYGSKLVARGGRILAVGVMLVSVVMLALINARDVWIVLAAFAALNMLYYGWRWLRARGEKSQEQEEQVIHPAAQEQTMPSPAEAEQTLQVPVRHVAAFLALTLVAGLFALVGSNIHERLPESMRIIEVEVRPSWEGTFAVGTAVYQERGVLFGSGPNTFTRQWGLYKPAGVNETAFWNTDFSQGIGFIPTALITAGLIGAAVWILFFATFLTRGVYSLVLRRVNRNWQPIIASIFFAALYLWTFHVIYPPGVTLIALTFLLTGLFVAAQQAAGVLQRMQITFGGHPLRAVSANTVLAILALVVLGSGFLVSRAIAADMYVNRAIVIYNENGNLSQAKAILTDARALSPQSNRAHRAAVELGLIELAERAAAGVETQEEQAQLQAILDETIASALAAVSASRADYQAWLILARVYQELAGVQVEGAYESAQGAYERAIEENPSSPEPHLRLAQLQIARGDLDAARGSLNAALARKQNYAIAHFLLSQVQVAQNEPVAARTSAERAAANAPQEPVAWFQVGVLHFGAGQYETAAQALERAVVLNNNYANALYVLGLTYGRLGRIDDARAVLNRVGELNPDNAAVAEALQALELVASDAEALEGDAALDSAAAQEEGGGE